MNEATQYFEKRIFETQKNLNANFGSSLNWKSFGTSCPHNVHHRGEGGNKKEILLHI